MEPLHLRSEDALLIYLKKFLKKQPKAVQLDGATSPAPAGVVLVFKYSVDDRQYKLAGNTSRTAIENFVRLAEEHGSAAIALKESKNSEGRSCLVLADGYSIKEWCCQPFASKATDRLHRAA